MKNYAMEAHQQYTHRRMNAMTPLALNGQIRDEGTQADTIVLTALFALAADYCLDAPQFIPAGSMRSGDLVPFNPSRQFAYELVQER